MEMRYPPWNGHEMAMKYFNQLSSLNQKTSNRAQHDDDSQVGIANMLKQTPTLHLPLCLSKPGIQVAWEEPREECSLLVCVWKIHGCVADQSIKPQLPIRFRCRLLSETRQSTPGHRRNVQWAECAHKLSHLQRHQKTLWEAMRKYPLEKMRPLFQMIVPKKNVEVPAMTTKGYWPLASCHSHKAGRTLLFAAKSKCKTRKFSWWLCTGGGLENGFDWNFGCQNWWFISIIFANRYMIWL